jgi:hypothetical protein
VDNCLIFNPSYKIIDEIIQHLQTWYKITTTSDIATYLSLRAIKENINTIPIRQPLLIEKVLQLCGLDTKSNEHLTLTDSILHPTNPTDEPRIHNWSYHQIIQILNCIAVTFWVDTTFVVCQCVRSSTAPTRKHELAIRQLYNILKRHNW